MYEDANMLFDSSVSADLKWPLHTLPSQDVARKGILKHGNERFQVVSNSSRANGVLNDSRDSPLLVEKMRDSDYYNYPIKVKF